MDYFADIVDNLDSADALSRLAGSTDYPAHLMPLAATHPSIWRVELINWLYLHPDFAAAVWRQSQRTRLARAAGLLPWPPTPGANNPLLRALGLSTTITEEEFQRSLTDATEQQLENVRRELKCDYRGPEFIEKLLAEV